MSEINSFNTLNSLDAYAKVMNENGGIGKFNPDLQKSPLQGHIELNVNQMNDKELLNDLSALNINPANRVATPDSADEMFKSFSNALSNGINNLNGLQKNSEDITSQFAAGANIDVHTVMIAAQKAHLSLELATQLRNKMINAYKEITKLQF